MAIVTIKNKYQIVIPQRVREENGVAVGDLLEARAEDGKLVFEPKSLVDRGIVGSRRVWLNSKRDAPAGHSPATKNSSRRSTRTPRSLAGSLENVRADEARLLAPFFAEATRRRRSRFSRPSKQSILLLENLRHPSLRTKKYGAK